MLEEFKKFAMRGNVVDLAVGVIIGAAFGAIVNSLVGDIIMPIVGAVTGGLDFSNYFVALSKSVTAPALADAKKQGILNEKPIRFDTAQFRDKVDSPLYFPGKVLADAKADRLYIADSTNHRIVVTDLKGNKVAIAGTGSPFPSTLRSTSMREKSVATSGRG